jgi:hypothetical protein
VPVVASNEIGVTNVLGGGGIGDLVEVIVWLGLNIVSPSRRMDEGIGLRIEGDDVAVPLLIDKLFYTKLISGPDHSINATANPSETISAAYSKREAEPSEAA